MATFTERYALERVIGRGASGSVWAARDLKLNRAVAIKQLDRQFADDVEACSRFEREAWTIAQLRSPHIVQVFDSGLDGGVPYIVMERLYGESLEDRLARYRHRSRLPPRIAAGIISDVARGLAISHEAGIVHRDLKPGNVFLASEQRREIAKLLDFGIARLMAEAADRSEPGVLAGTPQFMSPEHFAGQALDERSDLWSLAVMAYEMLTGQLPFSGDTLRELREQIRVCAFVPPTEVLPELSLTVDEVFAKAFARSFEDRFASAAEFSAAFDQLAGDNARAPTARALFVDDEPDLEQNLRMRYRADVEAGRYELLFARSAEEGLAVVGSRPDLDVVFADIKMPDRTHAGLARRGTVFGREGLSFLAQVPAVNPIVRVVVLTAYNYEADIVRKAMNHGAFDFLSKEGDFDLANLRPVIDKCAAEARKLRQLLESHQENELLRGLIGRSAVDRLVAEVRAADAPQTRTIPATVVLLTVPGAQVAARSGAAQRLFAQLNAHFDLFVPELQGRNGAVQSFQEDCLVALFQGREHLDRAVEACVAIVERVRVANTMSSDGPFEYSVSASVGTGPILEGRLGSTLVGRIERSVLGEPVRTAFELKALARPLEILISESVLSEVAATHRCETDPERTLSGGAMVCRVVGPIVTADSGVTPTLQEGQSSASAAEH